MLVRIDIGLNIDNYINLNTEIKLLDSGKEQVDYIRLRSGRLSSVEIITIKIYFIRNEVFIMLRMIITDKDNNEVKVVRSKNFNYIRREYRKFFYTGDELNSRCFEYDVKFYINNDEYFSFADFAYTVKEEY